MLAVVTCSAFLFNLMPRPVFFSMMLMCVTLTLVLEAHRTGRVQPLYWLPLIFLLWANLHIQFIYGLFVVGLLLAVNLAQRLAARVGWEPSWLVPPNLPIATLAAVFAACIIATCIGPNSYHLYQVILQYSQAKVPYRMIMRAATADLPGWQPLCATVAYGFRVLRGRAADARLTSSNSCCCPLPVLSPSAPCAMPGSSVFRQRLASPTASRAKLNTRPTRVGWRSSQWRR